MNPPGFYGEASQAVKDEYKEYCRQPILPCDTPLEWWGVLQQEFPYLSRIALISYLSH
jgi:hypothetical protein